MVKNSLDGDNLMDSQLFKVFIVTKKKHQCTSFSYLAITSWRFTLWNLPEKYKYTGSAHLGLKKIQGDYLGIPTISLLINNTQQCYTHLSW